jgi:hypothetical protein
MARYSEVKVTLIIIGAGGASACGGLEAGGQEPFAVNRCGVNPSQALRVGDPEP